MKLSTDFEQQVATLAGSTPREALAMLLTAFTPRVPFARPRAKAGLLTDEEVAAFNRATGNDVKTAHRFGRTATSRSMVSSADRRKRIVVTLKGNRKLVRVKDDDQFRIIAAGPDVSSVLRSGLQWSDITYAVKCGLIVLEGDEQ